MRESAHEKDYCGRRNLLCRLIAPFSEDVLIFSNVLQQGLSLSKRSDGETKRNLWQKLHSYLLPLLYMHPSSSSSPLQLFPILYNVLHSGYRPRSKHRVLFMREKKGGDFFVVAGFSPDFAALKMFEWEKSRHPPPSPTSFSVFLSQLPPSPVWVSCGASL